MLAEPRFRIIRDPVWNTIRVDPDAIRIIDTPAFQRLRYIRQLGFAHLVYPGATHTRFDHALGVYHLMVTALRLLREREDAPEEAWEGADLLPYAALLHDIGHYPYSHAVEELETERIPGDHEALSARFFAGPDLRKALEPLGADAPGRIHALIRGESDSPLAGLVSGSLDLDKLEYLKRDAMFCGVPYGEVDVGRLLQGLVLLRDPDSGRWEVGVQEKAVSALESLLFARYQMFRNVYWHHAVRAATALYKRIVEVAEEAELLAPEDLVGRTDEELLHLVERRAVERGDEIALRLSERWLPALRNRRLPKRAVELTAADLKGRDLPEWVEGGTARKRRVEDLLAADLGLEPGEVVIDYPTKRALFHLDILLERRSGEVERLGESGIAGVIDLPRLGSELYSTARILRVFTLERRRLPAEAVLDRIEAQTRE